MAYWMPKVYPWRLAILAILAKMANLCQRAGDSVWKAKVDPWRVAIFAKLATSAKMAKFGKNGEFGTIWRYPECGRYSSGCQVAP